jgi:uncharacterized protein YfaS (alpha-2-macroglobulin family)
MNPLGAVRQFLQKWIPLVFGRWQWQPPAWTGVFRERAARGIELLAADSRRVAIFFVALIGLLGGWYWIRSLPQPHYVSFTGTAPGYTQYGDNGISSIQPFSVQFSDPAAPLSSIGKPVVKGIELNPAIAGEWYWVTDRMLLFRPKNDWPIDTRFAVRFAKSELFDRRTALREYRLEFRTPPFSARIEKSEFYQDPRDPNVKKLVASVQFTHPVDTAQFERRISLGAEKDAEYLGLKPGSRSFSVTYDKFKLAAYVHSGPLGMPSDDARMWLRVDKGVRAARGGNDTAEALKSTITVPGRTSLSFSHVEMTLATNSLQEPEQVLLLTSTSPIAERALAGKVSLYLLPLRHPKQEKSDTEPYAWTDAAQVGKDIVAASQVLKTSYVPSDSGGDTVHGFKFNAPVGRYLFVSVVAGVEGIGGYVSGKTFIDTLRVAPYPPALRFLGQGALLSLGGDKKVGFVARDVDYVQVEIGRVLPNQLHHLSFRMYDYAKPDVADRLGDRIAERFTFDRDYRGKAPGKPTYDSVDLTSYLQNSPAGGRGLFLLRVQHKKPPEPNPQPPAPGQTVPENTFDDDYDYESYNEVQDSRLILITDLGMIVKRGKDGARDVFVQSIGSGQPVDGAQVEVLGRNGQPVLTAGTGTTGWAHLPKFPDLKREKAPMIILARKGSDFSFLPLRSQERALDFSRFDIGGVENPTSPQQVSAYLFSDRGIYRPGETAHLCVLARTADWKTPLAGLPIQVVVSDPRGGVVQRYPVKLSGTAFNEVAYASQAASPTGTYQASAYLDKDPQNPVLLGSTSFTVKEFEPDRMKVRLDLAEQAAEGWLRPRDVKIRATVMQLFGEPAGQRRVQGELSLTPALPQFARYPGYRFHIAEFLPEPYQESLPAAVTGDNGVAELKVDLSRFTGRAYRMHVLARAFEAQGGRNVAAQNSAIVSEADYLLGVKPDGDLRYIRRGSAHRAHWIAVNPKLTPVAVDGLSLEWVQRKYVSVLTQQDDRTYKYVSRLKETVRDTKKIGIAEVGVNIPLPTAEPGDFVLVLRDAAGKELNQLPYSVAGEANISRSLDRNAELQIQLDKRAYAAGDTIEVSIRAPYAGAGLITIERDKVYQHHWFKTATTSSVQRIQVPPGFEGNGYVTVEFARDPASEDIYLSPLSYGAAPFAADVSPHTQAVHLTAPKELKPGTVLTMRIAPAENSRVALLAVDEGILQVARYRNPDPLAYFFQKRMLEMETKQILDLILPEFKRFLSAAPGGDGDGSFARHLNPFSKKRKAPAAYWSGLVDAGPGGREFRYTVPDYFNGRMRIVAIAVGANRIGVEEAATEVKGDFVLTPNVPAAVAPGDEVVVSVGVFNNLPAGPVRLEVQPGAGLTALTPTTLNLTIASKKEQAAEFRFRANPVLGPASLKLVARRGNAEARMEESIGVGPPTAYRTQLTLGRFESGNATVPLKRDLYPEHRKVEAAISAVPLVWGQGIVAWLDDYPYTCTEQIVSKGFAALVVGSHPELGTVRGVPLEKTFAALWSRANAEGGFGLWTSSPLSAEFPTVYAAHFLVEARERGQPVPAESMAAVNEWLNRFAAKPASSLGEGRAKAYAVYLLARQGVKPTAALANVEQELSNRYAKTWTTDIAAAWLASTYRLMQRDNEANNLIRNVPWSVQKRDWSGDFYYDPVVHDAELLYLLARHFPSRLNDAPASVLEGIGAAVNSDRINSLSAATTLLALDSYARAAAKLGRFGVMEVGKDGREKVRPLSAGVIGRAAIAAGVPQVRFSKEGALAAYYSLDESGFDRKTPAALSQGVEILRDFLDAKGSPTARVRVGEEFLVRLRLRATQSDVPQVAVVDLLPGGVEIVPELAVTADSSTPGVDPATAANAPAQLPVGVMEKSNWRPEFAEVREDRLILYGNATHDAGTFVYRVRATSAGVFQVAPAFAEGMYDRKVSGFSGGGRLEVVKP